MNNETNKITENLDFSNRVEREKFINNNSGIFEGTNYDGEKVLVQCQQENRMLVKTIHPSKSR